MSTRFPFPLLLELLATTTTTTRPALAPPFPAAATTITVAKTSTLFAPGMTASKGPGATPIQEAKGIKGHGKVVVDLKGWFTRGQGHDHEAHR